MDKVVNIESILVYKEAVKRLESLKMDFDKKKLVDNPELCREIIMLIDYYSSEK